MINISFLDVQQAQQRVAAYVKKTSLTKSDFFSKKIGQEIFLKWETEQEIKSFKLRGALNKVFSLTDEQRKKGLIAASAGNHAQGVSLAAHYAKAHARVVMMKTASKIKIEGTKKFGAEVILKGSTYDECYAYAKSIQGDSIFIHPYADSFIIAGQATIALEILEQQKDIDSIVVPIGGGGLISGIAYTIKHLKPSCKVYGVVWQGTPDFCKQYHKNSQACVCEDVDNVQNVQSKSGLTDGIAVKHLQQEMLDFCKNNIDDIACITQQEISKTIVDVALQEGKVAEGSGVAALTAVIKKKQDWDLGKKCCVVVSGGNIDPSTLSQLIQQRREDS